jgi:DNA-binding transcriptional ArsR family regulator
MAGTKKWATTTEPVGGLKPRTQQVVDASQRLKMASDPTRLQILLSLSDGERSVSQLASELGESEPAVSHHLTLLRFGGMIAARRQGSKNIYGLTGTGDMVVNVVQHLTVGYPRKVECDLVKRLRALVPDVDKYWFNAKTKKRVHLRP